MRSEVRAHVALHGITTQRVVSRLFLNENGEQAFRLLQAMTAAGELYQHGRLYTLCPDPPRRKEQAQAYAILWFAYLDRPMRMLLSPEQLMRLAQPLNEQFGVRSPKKSFCYLDRATKKLVLLRVQPTPRGEGPVDLQRVLSHLQTLVNTESFELWAYLAMSHSFMLVFLMWEGNAAGELSRWLRRRPLMSDLVNPPVEIPVLVRKTRLPP